MKPIYCIEEYEYFNPYGNHPGCFDSIRFLVLLSCREGTVQLEYNLRTMVEACKKHEPSLYLYLQNLLANIEEFYQSDTRLIRGLEQDGFDMSRLLHVLLDHEDMAHIANWTKQHGANQQRRTAVEIQKSYAGKEEDEDEDEADEDSDFLLDFGEYLEMKTEVTRKVYAAMKAVALGHLPTLNLMETKLVHRFNTCLNSYAMMMVEMATSKWEELQELEDVEDEYDEEDEDDPSTLAGRRQSYLEFRQENPVNCEGTPVFCVEILDFVEEWERGWNTVTVWYKLSCAEGYMFDEIGFGSLIEEAMLYFPDIYTDAMSYYKASNSPRPRHPAMLRGLQRKGYDLTPVLASYLANQRDFMPLLREVMRLRRLDPDREDLFTYESERKSWSGLKDPVRVQEHQLVSLLHDSLVTEGMAVILRELPGFRACVPESFLDYMEDWAYNEYIDPINDLHDELEAAFELRRGYKREDG